MNIDLNNKLSTSKPANISSDSIGLNRQIYTGIELSNIEKTIKTKTMEDGYVPTCFENKLDLHKQYQSFNGISNKLQSHLSLISILSELQFLLMEEKSIIAKINENSNKYSEFDIDLLFTQITDIFRQVIKYIDDQKSSALKSMMMNIMVGASEIGMGVFQLRQMSKYSNDKLDALNDKTQALKKDRLDTIPDTIPDITTPINPPHEDVVDVIQISNYINGFERLDLEGKNVKDVLDQVEEMSSYRDLPYTYIKADERLINNKLNAHLEHTQSTISLIKNRNSIELNGLVQAFFTFNNGIRGMLQFLDAWAKYDTADSQYLQKIVDLWEQWVSKLSKSRDGNLEQFKKFIADLVQQINEQVIFITQLINSVNNVSVR